MSKKKPTFLLDGPVSYYYYENDNKNILLFGDMHKPFKKCNNLNILKLFENLIFLNKKKKGCMDFFLEKMISLNNKNKISADDPKTFNNKEKLINKIRVNLGNRKMLSDEYGLRIHYIDIGQVYMEENNLIKHDLILFPKSLLNNQEILDFFNEKRDNIHKLLFGICIYTLNEEASQYNTEYKLGEQYYKLLRKKNIQINEFIRRKLKKQIDKIKTGFFTKKQLYDFISKRLRDNIPEKEKKKILDFENLTQFLLYIRILLIDAYTICRMFRIFKSASTLQNIVYYAGASHTYNISRFLEEIKFKLKHSYDTSNGYFTEERLAKVIPCIPLKMDNYFGYDIDDLLNSNFYLDKNCEDKNKDINEENHTFYKGTLENNIITTKKDTMTLAERRDLDLPIKVCKSIFKL